MVKVYSHTKLTYNDFWKTLFEKTAKKKREIIIRNYVKMQQSISRTIIKRDFHLQKIMTPIGTDCIVEYAQ